MALTDPKNTAFAVPPAATGSEPTRVSASTTTQPALGPGSPFRRLDQAARVHPDKLLSTESLARHGGISDAACVLIVLAAGKGTRFGQQPKCIQPVLGRPLARHSVEAFRSVSPSPAICLVGYRYDEVAAAIGSDNIYVRSDEPAGGTAFAVFEAFSVPGLLEANPLLVITMGDRVVPDSIFRRLLETQSADGQPADLTFLTARYEPPKHLGKGRVLRDTAGHVTRLIEEKDIASEPDEVTRQALQNLTEGNCPLYAIRATTLWHHLSRVTNDNAQGQYYLTDIVASISAAGGVIRTITTSPSDSDYDLLCSDVTRPQDLALLEGVLARRGIPGVSDDEIERAAKIILADRPAGQVASIARQLDELATAAARDKLGFQPDEPASIGISGGRLRIAFMHPDMGRFFGPAWQMPIGAADAQGNEQIVVLAQTADDRRLHLHPLDPKYRENVNFVSADDASMYPGTEIADWHTYEGFGTRMSEKLLLSLGYFSDEEIATRRQKGLPLPPASLRVSDNMRRPFALVGNAIASLRTVREGHLGAQVQAVLGREGFGGLRIACTGGIPHGGFSSSSALTVATKNALNSLFALDIPPDVLVHLACQAEYGTGVRAGSLDQATEQKGRAGQGTLISSNPADNYRILGTYPVPTDRFKVFFPYTIDRDRASWRWSGGAYAESSTPDGPLTAGEIRKMTGKAAEIAAILTRLPLDTSFFKEIEDDLLADGLLDDSSRAWVCGILRQLPLSASCDDLHRRLDAERDWYLSELMRVHRLDRDSAAQKAETTIAALFSGWRGPGNFGLRIADCGLGEDGNDRPGTRDQKTKGQEGSIADSRPLISVASVPQSAIRNPQSEIQRGVPLRAMLAYLFSEVAKNAYLIHHPEQWIEYVTRSQQGDRSVTIDVAALPDAAALRSKLDWETGLKGPALLDEWLKRVGAVPYDFNAGLDETALAAGALPDFHRWPGGSFFRGLALIDLAEAMLKRAFGEDAVAVRVNAAGQGDYFQVHVDTTRARVDDVKSFLRAAFYRRFGLAPDPEFVETHPGAGAIGIRVSRFSALRSVIEKIRPAS